MINPPVQHFVISSPLEGQLMDNGKPLPKVKLIRKLEWNGSKEGKREDVVITDAAGMFAFDVFELDMAMRGLEQFVAYTYIYILREGQEERLIWYNPKQFKGLYDELGKKLENLICDVNEKEIVIQKTKAVRSPVVTICRWDDMPEFVESFDILME